MAATKDFFAMEKWILHVFVFSGKNIMGAHKINADGITRDK